MLNAKMNLQNHPKFLLYNKIEGDNGEKMKHTMGEGLNIRFDRKIILEFHGARLTSDSGFLASRELEEALGLFNSASDQLCTQFVREWTHSAEQAFANPRGDIGMFIAIIGNPGLFKIIQ
jgi:hypothetical protein